MKKNTQNLFIRFNLVALVGLLLVSFLSTSYGVKGYAVSMSGNDLLINTNIERTESSLNQLELNRQLTEAAQAKADHMANNSYWSHQAPDGTTPWSFIDRTGLNYFKAGENLAYGFKNADNTVEAWMDSESHRANILDDSYDIVGFGYVNTPNFEGGPSTIVVAMYADIDNAPALATNTQTSSSSGQEINLFSAALDGDTDLVTSLILVLTIIVGFSYLNTHLKHAYSFVVRGEKLLHQHPMLEASLVYAAAIALLTTTTGAIL